MDKDGIHIGNFLLKLDKIPHVYITSSLDNVTIDRVQATRPYGFFTKPIDPNSIVININIILNNYQHRHVDIVRKVFDHSSQKSETPFILKEVVQYINDNIFNLIEIDQLVILTNWEKDHFLRMFTKHLGLTPYQYILHRKMDKAMGFLMETELSIVDIAYDLGFNSHSNFCVRFKKIVGISPIEFRKINKIKKRLNS
jgi:AraC-like DNA-binding protein